VPLRHLTALLLLAFLLLSTQLSVCSDVPDGREDAGSCWWFVGERPCGAGQRSLLRAPGVAFLPCPALGTLLLSPFSAILWGGRCWHSLPYERSTGLDCSALFCSSGFVAAAAVHSAGVVPRGVRQIRLPWTWAGLRMATRRGAPQHCAPRRARLRLFPRIRLQRGRVDILLRRLAAWQERATLVRITCGYQLLPLHYHTLTFILHSSSQVCGIGCVRTVTLLRYMALRDRRRGTLTCPFPAPPWRQTLPTSVRTGLFAGGDSACWWTPWAATNGRTTFWCLRRTLDSAAHAVMLFYCVYAFTVLYPPYEPRDIFISPCAPASLLAYLRATYVSWRANSACGGPCWDNVRAEPQTVTLGAVVWVRGFLHSGTVSAPHTL